MVKLVVLYISFKATEPIDDLKSGLTVFHMGVSQRKKEKEGELREGEMEKRNEGERKEEGKKREKKTWLFLKNHQWTCSNEKFKNVSIWSSVSAPVTSPNCPW